MIRQHAKSDTGASMEPQLFSCGLCAPEWQGPTARYPLQWSRNFSVADCKILLRGWVPKHSFNGAATFQLRIVLKDAQTILLNYIASMEPQLFSCGLQISGTDSIAPKSCFNGAATFQLRIECMVKKTSKDILMLQWSRNFSVAD